MKICRVLIPMFLVVTFLVRPSLGQQNVQSAAAQSPPPAESDKSSEPSPLTVSSTGPGVVAPHLENAQVLKQLTDIHNEVVALKKQSWIKDLGPSAVAFFALIVTSVISVVSLNRNAALARETLRSKAHEEERKAIRERRDRFYGPFTQLRGVSKLLYEIFNARRTDEERVKYGDSEGRFRTLFALCRGHEFSDGVDQVLLGEIVRIGEESASLITKEIGLVDNPTLQAGLSRAVAHYRIFKLAAERKFLTNGDEFLKFSFPYEIDKLIAEQIATLDARLRKLEHMSPQRPATPEVG